MNCLLCTKKWRWRTSNQWELLCKLCQKRVNDGGSFRIYDVPNGIEICLVNERLAVRRIEKN